MIGDVLKKLREIEGVTQDQMAEVLCVKRQTYSAYERNVSIPDANTLKQLAEYFRVSADVLLGVDNKKATLEDQILTDEQKKIANASKDVTEDETTQILDYIEFVKSKRKN